VPRDVRRRWVGTTLLAAFAAVQVWLGAGSGRVWLERVPGQLRGFLGAPDAAPTLAPEVAAARALPRFAAAIPERSRVLLVTSVLVRVQYEFWFLPRPFRMLLHVPPDTLDLVARAWPEYLWFAAHRLRTYAARGQVLTEERLQQELATTEYVVAFAGGAPEFDSWRSRAGAAALEVVLACDDSVLYRVRR